jgi:CheY-like chemotaxis protein
MNAINILLVEDNPGDVRLLETALQNSHLVHELKAVSDSVQAFKLLINAEPTTRAYRPDIIVLDLNLPGKNGLEILEELKGDGDLKDIPVIVLTSSDRDLDVLVAYRKQANAYMVKPSSFNEFDEIVNAIEVLSHLGDDSQK